jgi:hypothetical protein
LALAAEPLPREEIIPVITVRKVNTLMTKRSGLFWGLSILSLLLLTGCAVPGGYDVNSLHLQPEAALVYPGSTGVQTNDYNGSPGNYVSKGAVAVTGKTATTIHTRLEVLAYFSKTLAANGWTKTREDDRITTPEGLPAQGIAWVKQSLHLSYVVNVWTVGEATQYFTQLSANE